MMMIYLFNFFIVPGLHLKEKEIKKIESLLACVNRRGKLYEIKLFRLQFTLYCIVYFW